MVQRELGIQGQSTLTIERDFSDARSILESRIEIPKDFAARNADPERTHKFLPIGRKNIELTIKQGNLLASGYPEPPKRVNPERQVRLREIADMAHIYGFRGPIADVHNWYSLGSGVGKEKPPEDLKGRIEWFANVAREINSFSLLTAGQVFELGNFGPGGYYRSGMGIGRLDSQQKMTSAFSTLNEEVPEYPRAYAHTCLQAYRRLSEVRSFTHEDPFMIILLGDGEGRIGEALRQHIDLGSFGEHIRVTVLDLSDDLLSVQSGRVHGQDSDVFFHIKWDARHVGGFISMLERPIRGAIIAGEELVDVFAPIAIGKHLGQLCEIGYEFPEGQPYKKIGIPIHLSAYSPILTKMFEVFPQYERLLMDEVVPAGEMLPVNFGFMALMKSIAESNFQGYWMMGDYIGGAFGQFSTQENKLRNTKRNPPVRAFSRLSPAHCVPIERVFSEVCDVTGDVDTALLHVGYAYGMRKELLSRPFQFIDVAFGKPSFSRAELEIWTRRLGQQIAMGLSPADELRLLALFDRIGDLFEGRFNFVGSFGPEESVPKLFPSNPPKEW